MSHYSESTAPDGEPFRPARITWYNDAAGAKIACLSGRYDAVPYGADLRWKQFRAKGKPPHPEHGQFQGTGYACSPSTLTIGIDGDHPAKWADTATGRYLGSWQGVATSERETPEGTLKFHIMIRVPPELVPLWPKQEQTPFGHIKSNGFTYDTGMHASGTAYEATGHGWLTADAGLMLALLEDAGGRLHESSGAAADDDYSAEAATWTDPDGEYPAETGAAVLGGSWGEGERNDSLPWRCSIIKTAGWCGVPGMARLFSDLCAKYDAEKGLGDAGDDEVYRAFARAEEWRGGVPGYDPRIHGNGSEHPNQAGSEPPVNQVPGEPEGQPIVLAPVPGRRHALSTAAEVTPERVRWLWAHRLKLGGLALLAGREGLGKSTIAIDVAARITRGTLEGEHHGTPRAVLIVATEDDWADTVVPRLIAAGADLDLVYRVAMTTETGGTDEIVLPYDTGELAAAITETDAALVILDPLMSRLGSALDSHKDAEVRTALEPVSRLASETGVTVLGLIHPNKSGGTDANNTVMGSRAFTAVARSVLYATAHPDEGKRALGHCVLFVSKNNLSRRAAAGHVYVIQEKTLDQRDPRDGSRIDTGCVCWLGALEDVTLEDALAATGRASKVSVVDKAAEWLAGWLAERGGQASSREAKDAGGAAGHSEISLKRAVTRDAFMVENTQTKPRRTIWKLNGSQSDHARAGRPKVDPTGHRRLSLVQQQPTDLGKQDGPQSDQESQSDQLSGPPREAVPTAIPGWETTLTEDQRDRMKTLLRCPECHPGGLAPRYQCENSHE